MFHARDHHAETVPTSRHRRWAAPVLVASLLMLAGCAGGHVQNVAFAPPHSSAPAALRIEVTLAPDLRDVAAATHAAAVLQADLVKRYAKAGLAALPADGNPLSAQGTATLRVDIARADPGNRLKRLVIGFGAGHSSLSADISLDSPGEAAPLWTFSSSADSGHKPGLILPGGIAAATGNMVHLAIGGGLDLALSGHAGLKQNADRSAKLIVDETRKLYDKAGWTWPSSRGAGGSATGSPTLAP